MTSVLESEPRPSNPPTTDKLAGRVAFSRRNPWHRRGDRPQPRQSGRDGSGGLQPRQGQRRPIRRRHVDEDTAPRRIGLAHRGNVGSSGDCRRTIARGDRRTRAPRRRVVRRRRNRQHRPGDLRRVEVRTVRATETLAKEAAYQLAKSGKSTDDGIGITVNTVTPA